MEAHPGHTLHEAPLGHLRQMNEWELTLVILCMIPLMASKVGMSATSVARLMLEKITLPFPITYYIHVYIFFSQMKRQSFLCYFGCKLNLFVSGGLMSKAQSSFAEKEMEAYGKERTFTLDCMCS
jgi:hypothetical protein